MNPYQTLGVPRSATEADVRRAYRKLTMEYHPDRNPGDAQAEERFKEITIAYSILSDGDKRSVYDATGSVDPRTAAMSDDEIVRTVRGFMDTFAAFLDVRMVQDDAVRPRKKKKKAAKKKKTAKKAKNKGCKMCGGAGYKVMKQGVASYQIPCKSCAVA
jgi:DnaJ-class molecular chaperone